eukprot:gene24536-29649_t
MLVNLHHIDHRILYSNVRLEGGVSVVELWQLEGSDNSFLVQALECHQVVDIVLFFTSEEATVMNILTAASYLFTANVLSVQAYRDAVLSYTGNYLAVVLPFDNLSSASLTSSASSTNPTSQHLTVYDLSPLLGANPSSHQDLEIFHSSTQLLADDPIIRTSFRRTYAHTSSDLLVTLHQSGKVVIYEVAQVQELEDDSIVAIALNAAIRVGKLGVGEKIGGEKGGDQDSSENTSLVRIVEKVVVKKILEVAHTHLLQYVSNHSDGTDILKSVGVGWIYGIGCTSTNAPSSATPSSPAIPPLIPSSKGAIRKDKVVSVWGGNGVWLVIHMQATDGSVCVVCVFVQYDYYTKEYVVAYDKMLKFALQVDAGVDVPVRIHENINAYFCTHTTLPTALDVVYGLDIPAHTHARSSSFMVSRALLSIHSQPPHTHNHIHTHVQRMSCYLINMPDQVVYMGLPNDLHHTLHIHALHHSDENTVYVALYKVASMCMHAKFGKELDTFVDTSDTHTHNDSPNLTPVDDTYTVAIHPDPVYGLGLRLDEVKTQTHTNIVVTAFKPHPVTNQPMACEVTGCIQLGDHLIGVNDVSFSESTSAGEVGGNNSTTTGLPLATVVKHIKAACSAGQGRSEVVLKLRRAQQTQVHKLALQAPAAPTQTPRQAAAVFLLAPTHGNIKAALNCLAGQNNDPCLAHLVARVLETRIGTRNMNGNSMSSNIGGSSYDIPDVVQKLQKDAQKVSNIYSHQVLTHDLIPALQKASQSHSSLEEANFCGFVGVDATVVGVVGALWLQDDGMLRTKFDSLLHHLKRDIHTHTGSLSERTSLIVSSEWCAAMTGMYRDKLAASDIRIIHDFLQYVGIHIPTIHHHHSMHLLCIWLISLAEMLDKKSDGTNGLCVDKVRDVYETYYSLHDLHEEVLLVGEIIDKPIANAFASFTQRMMEEGKQKRLQAHTQLMASTSTPTSQNNQSSPTPAAPKMTFNFASMSKPTPPSSISVQPAARSVLDMYDVPPKAPVQAATVPSSALDTYDAPARPQRSATAGSSDRTAAPSALDMFDVPTRPQRSTTSKVNSSASHAPSALDMFDAPSRPLRSSAGPSAGTNSGPANAEASNINVNANVSASVGGVHSALDVFDAPSRPLRSNAATGSGAYNNASASAVGVPNALDTFEAPSRPLRSTGGSGVNSNAVSANSGVGSGKGSANVAPNALDMFDVPSRPLRSGAESGGSTNASSGTSSANIILHASGSGSAGAVSNALDMFDAPSRPLRNTAGLDAVANSSEVISAASNAHASTNANDNDANVHASSNSSSVGAPNALDVFDVPSRPLRSSVGSSVSATSSTASSRVNDINVIAGAATSVGAPNALDMFDVPSRPLRSSAGSSVNSNAGSVIQGAITGNVHASAVGVPNALDVFDAPSRPLRSSSGTGATGGAAGSNVDAKASAHVSSSSSSVGVPHAVDVFDVPSRPVRSSTGSGASTNASTASTGGKSGNSSVITHTVDDFKAVSTPGAQMQSVESSVSASSAPSFGSSPPPQPTPSVVSAALPHAPKPPSLSVASTPAMSSLLDLDIPTIPEEKDGYNEDAGDGDILTSPKLLSASSDERERVLSALRKETSMSSMPSMGNIDIMEEIRKIEDASSGTKVKPQTPTPSSIPAPAPSTPTSNEGGKKEGKLLVPFKHQEAGSASASKVVDSAKKGTHHVEGGGGLQHKSSFLGGLFHPHGHPPSSASKRSTPNSSAHGGSTHGVTREPHPHSSPSSSVLTEFEQRIFRFYSIHNPDKLDTVRDIVKKFEGRENELIAKLERQAVTQSEDLAEEIVSRGGQTKHLYETPHGLKNTKMSPSKDRPSKSSPKSSPDEAHYNYYYDDYDSSSPSRSPTEHPSTDDGMCCPCPHHKPSNRPNAPSAPFRGPWWAPSAKSHPSKESPGKSKPGPSTHGGTGTNSNNSQDDEDPCHSCN